MAMIRAKKLLFILVAVAGLAIPVISTGAPLLQQTGRLTAAFHTNNMGKGNSIGFAESFCSYQLFTSVGARAYNADFPDPHSGQVLDPGQSESIVLSQVPASALPDGDYSGVVSCTEPAATALIYRDEGDARADAYVATSVPDTTLYAPTIYRNFWEYYTKLHIQNVETIPQTIRVQYFALGSATPVKTSDYTLQRFETRTIDQATIGELQPNQAYSAKITSLTGNLLAAVAQIYGSGSTVKELYAYEAFPGAGVTRTYQAVIMSNYWGYNTATVIQNIGGATATVRVTYSNGKVLSYSIPPNAAQTVLDYNQVPSSNNLYSSVVESTNGQPILVLVNESTPATHRATTYIGASKGARNIAVPVVLRNYNGYNSSITCQNLGTSNSGVRISYRGVSNSGDVNLGGIDVTPSLPPGQSVLIYPPDNAALGDGFIGAATVAALQPIACIANQDRNTSPYINWVNDFLAAYNGVEHPQ